MKKCFRLFFAFLVLWGSLHAAVTVNGRSIVEAKPDVIYLSFIVEKDGINASEAQDFHKKIVNNVLVVLNKNEIAPERIKSDNYSLCPVYPDDKKEKVVYRSSIRIVIEFFQVSDLGPLIDQVLAVGNTRIEKIAFDLRTEDAVRKEALRGALQDAKNKAQVMAEELSLNLGKAVSADEKLEIIYEGKNTETLVLRSKNESTDIVLRNKIFVRAETVVVFESSPKE